MSAALEIWAPGTLGEVDAGADLARLLLDGCRQEGLSLQDGDIVVITSKVVSKVEGRVAAGDREEAIRAETVALLAERGATQVVRSRLGLVHAAAGVDASGVSPGQIALLPLDPDASARVVRERCQELAGVTVGVLISDTAGRPWRMGQTDLAIGAAGVRVLDDHSGRDDGYGNRLAVTCPAVADELCSAAELASGKTGRRPLVVIRGRADLVLPAG
ncbi:MAG: coenzyme F420-0:L-glutamate ligase, partial [Nocardioides sp.]